jgi:hypothetical protein
MIKKVHQGDTLTGVFDYLNLIKTQTHPKCSATSSNDFTKLN